MRVLVWACRILIFLFLFAFALKNTETVSLRFLFGAEWQAPLVIVVLAFFAGGAVLGVLSVLGTVFRLRRELGQTRREVAKLRPVAEPPALNQQGITEEK